MSPPINRRSFCVTLAASAMAATTAHSRIPREDQPRTAIIGCGKRGQELLRAVLPSIVAICDVDERQLARAGKIAGSGVRAFTDHQMLLYESDAEAVLIATPNHWHGLQ